MPHPDCPICAAGGSLADHYNPEWPKIPNPSPIGPEARPDPAEASPEAARGLPGDIQLRMRGLGPEAANFISCNGCQDRVSILGLVRTDLLGESWLCHACMDDFMNHVKGAAAHWLWELSKAAKRRIEKAIAPDPEGRRR